MKKTFLSIVVLVCCAAVNAQDTKQSVDSLNWISGCWEMNVIGRVTTERWGKATENLMLGTSQTAKGTKSVAFEYLRIVNNGQGFVYIAKPSSAKEETSFTAAKVGDKEITFENLKHDFPQRIIYKQTKPDALASRIEGMMDGKLTVMDFAMARVKCE